MANTLNEGYNFDLLYAIRKLWGFIEDKEVDGGDSSNILTTSICRGLEERYHRSFWRPLDLIRFVIALGVKKSFSPHLGQGVEAEAAAAAAAAEEDEEEACL
ncbi:hypothetical protein V6N13_098407 [Hibiscus sabdariffa]|uniref:Uncharacterized protein n=1 Tax=Hibiscus sabdariffa TaxID=183260 RepID=A0ABR2EDP7_9ROSI